LTGTLNEAKDFFAPDTVQGNIDGCASMDKFLTDLDKLKPDQITADGKTLLITGDTPQVPGPETGLFGAEDIKDEHLCP